MTVASGRATLPRGAKVQHKGPWIASWMPIGCVKPYPGNPRQNAEAVAKVVASIREFGFRQPIVTDEKMMVLAGHTRLLAARELGLATVPVHVAKGLTSVQARAYRLADNRVAQEAEWDMPALRLEIGKLDALAFDLTLTGFDPDEISKMLGAAAAGDGGAKLGDVVYEVIVSCATEQEQAALCERLEAEGRTCRLLTL